MPLNRYHFRAHWRLNGDIDAVYALISRSQDFARWWPAGFIDALEIQPGDADGVGKVVRFETKGWAPYRYLWHASTLAATPPAEISLKLWGDFEGTAAWRLVATEAGTEVVYERDVIARKPFERWLSPLLRPLFTADQRWQLARGEQSLRLELARRRAEAAPATVAPPPRPAPSPPLPLVAALTLLAVVLLRRRPRRR